MSRQAKCFSGLVPLLAAFLFAVLLPATASASHPGDGGTPPGAIYAGPGGGGGGGGVIVGSGDPDELGIYRALPPSGRNSGPASSSSTRTDGPLGALLSKLRILRAFLLGFRFPGI
jgi:hypothetical protein